MRTLYCLLVGMSLFLSGCGTFFGEDGVFRDREEDYLKAGSIEPLQVPDHLQAGHLGERYRVPALTREDRAYAQDLEEFEVPRPEPLSASALREQVKIQKLGEERWILVNVEPAELWPQIRAFLADNGLEVASTDTELGLMQTRWLSFKDDPDRIDRYRIRIERGVQPDTSEIHVLHMNLDREEATQAQLNSWPEQSSSAERESWMVDELAATLAAQDLGTAGGTSLIAQNIGGEVKAGIDNVDGEPLLRLELNRPRAMATLTHAAQQEGFAIYDSASDEGFFYLGYREPEGEPGWLASLFGADGDNPPPETPYSLAELRDALPSGLLANPSQAEVAEERLPDAPGYLLVVTNEGSGAVEARLRTPYGERLSPRRTRELLAILRQNLI